VKTEIVAGNDEGIARAAVLLRAGDPVAFPTETVYGLGARANDADAVRRIYEAKGRPEHKPLIVHVRDVEQARLLVREWPPEAEELARLYWPGPLTLVLPRAAIVPDVVTAGRDSVAVRAPAHPIAQRLIVACGFALAAPSANPSGLPPPTSAAEVAASLRGKIRLVVDGGPTPGRTPSTILDLCRTDGAAILRVGAIPADELARHVRLIPSSSGGE
jgi:L-threonylcarbamoyladenylate synthase